MNNIDLPHGAIRIATEYLDLQPQSSIYIYVDSELSPEGIVYAKKLSEYYSAKYVCTIDMNNQIPPEDISTQFNAYIFASGVKSHGKSKAVALKKLGKKVVRIFNFGPDLFSSCFVPSQKEIQQLNMALIDRAAFTNKIIISDDKGTCLTVGLDPAFQWTDSHGAAHHHLPGILPPGEVNTFPANVNGVLIANGALNSSVGLPCSPILDKDELYIEIKDGEIIYWTCTNSCLKTALKDLFSVDNALRVGEIGLGTNRGVESFVPYVSHINGRRFGPHIGFGTQPAQSSNNVDWTSLSHLNVIVPDAHVFFDDTLIYDGRQYCIEQPYSEKNIFSGGASKKVWYERVYVDVL